MNLDNRESLVIHIEGLQTTLAKRNQRIAELEAKIANPEWINETAVKRAYKRGWQEASRQMLKMAQSLEIGLGQLRQVAWETYKEKEEK